MDQPDRHQQTIEALRRVLIQVARMRSTITYGELAAEIGMHHRSRFFMVCLIDLCHEERDLGRGPMCAMVVQKASGIPGGGYWKVVLGEETDWDDLKARWREELETVHDYWTEHDRD